MVEGIRIRAVAIWARWLEVLAGLLFAGREIWRAQRPFIVSHEDDRLVVRQGEPPSGLLARLTGAHDARSSRPASVAAESREPEDFWLALRNGFVIHELATDNIVVRQIRVPVQAREFLPGIVRNQVERLSPWDAGQTVYGFSDAVSSDDAVALDVRVLITSRDAINSARNELEAVGLAPDRIVARTDGAAAPVALWSRFADVPREAAEQTRQRIGGAIAAFVLVSIALSMWAFFSAAGIRAESEELAARSRTLQRQLQGSRTPQAIASLPAAERAWAWKETAPSMVIMFEALSRALPDAAYLTELRLDNATTLHIVGLTRDAPSLIAPLEHSGHLTGVHFFAPTTRGPDGSLFRFNIEARVVPRFDLTEK
jgi:general secretion pathway protein L